MNRIVHLWYLDETWKNTVAISYQSTIAAVHYFNIISYGEKAVMDGTWLDMAIHPSLSLYVYYFFPFHVLWRTKELNEKWIMTNISWTKKGDFWSMWLFQPRIGLLFVQATSQRLAHFDTSRNKFLDENSNEISHACI